MKHTPGPWKAGYRTVTAPETDERLGLDVRVYGGNADDNRANSRLIAVAPDLFEEAIASSGLLQALRAHLAPYVSARVLTDIDARVASLDAAIAKASGRPA